MKRENRKRVNEIIDALTQIDRFLKGLQLKISVTSTSFNSWYSGSSLAAQTLVHAKELMDLEDMFIPLIESKLKKRKAELEKELEDL